MNAVDVLSIKPTARQRKWWAALALAALAFLSLRPACDAWLSHWDKHEGAHHLAVHQASVLADSHAPADPVCCTTIEAGGLVKPFDMAVWRADPSKTTVALFAQPAPAPAARLQGSLTASVRPPGNASFYVRSARILR